MKKKHLIIFIIIGYLSILMAESSKYYTVDEYLNKYPTEVKISNTFKKIIKNPSLALQNTNQKILKIVMVYPGNQISDYWRRSKESFEKRLKELNISYVLMDFFTEPGHEIDVQAQQIRKALKHDTDYLIFTLDANKHSRFIERIMAYKSTKIILQNITTPLKKWSDKQAFLYVGFDHYIGSKMLADYYIKKSSNEGNYAVLYGTKGYVSFMRGKKFVHYLKQHSKLKLVAEYYTNMNKEKSRLATLDILENNPNLKFIYACTTDISLGIIQALKEKNLLGKIMVNGWGGGSEELKAIENKTLDVTVMRMNDDNGVAMAEAIKLVLLNKEKEVPKIYSGSFKLVEKNIAKKLLEEYKKTAFRYSGV